MARVCVLGKEGSLFAKMILRALKDQGIESDVIWVSKKRKESKFASRLLIPYNLYKSLNTGRFKALPKSSLWTWKLFFRMRNEKVPSHLSAQLKELKNLDIEGKKVPSTNHVRTYTAANEGQYDICILGGVDIVDEAIIKTFKTACLNAHPAPLPECRGGGALENTLYQGLNPASSVHRVTAGIDEGGIFDVSEIELEKSDNFRSIYLKLQLEGARQLADITKQFLEGIDVEEKENNGKLYFWKEMNLKVQKKAHSNLKRMLADLS